MPNRWQTPQRQELYDQIARYEGEWCLSCYCEGAGRRGPPTIKLEIDEAGRERHLLCKTHNLEYRRLSLADHISLVAGYSAMCVCVRIKEGTYIRDVKTGIDRTLGSVEIQINNQAEGNWVKYVSKIIRRDTFIGKSDAVVTACGEPDIDVSMETCRRYYLKYSAPGRAFQEIIQDGQRGLIFRKINTAKGIDK
jgi:hypothetical protein